MRGLCAVGREMRDGIVHDAPSASDTQTRSSTQRNVSKYFIRAATAAAAIAFCVLFADIVGSRVYKALQRDREKERKRTSVSVCVCVALS